jgi:hypothetical protein
LTGSVVSFSPFALALRCTLRAIVQEQLIGLPAGSRLQTIPESSQFFFIALQSAPTLDPLQVQLALITSQEKPSLLAASTGNDKANRAAPMKHILIAMLHLENRASF